MSPWTVARRLKPNLLLERALEQVWLDKSFFGLRYHLDNLPPVPAAKIPVSMEPVDLGSYTAFQREFEIAEGADVMDVYARERLREAGVQTAYHTVGPNGEPAYAQWLIGFDNQDQLHHFQPGRYPRLQEGEGLLEGAYAFIAFRGQGVMAPALIHLLHLARGQGLRALYAYVAVENVASLRGCAKVGFTPHHVRFNTRRLGQVQTRFVNEIGPEWMSLWTAALQKPAK